MVESILIIISKGVALIGVFIVAYSAFRSLTLYCWGIYGTSISTNSVRLKLGDGIILGLEFMVGADIIQSIAKPTYYDLGILAALVCIRTFLSYFLNKELQGLAPEIKASVQDISK